MLYAVTGRPGEGKSCWAVIRILEELKETTRPIYTNIYLHRGKIYHYLKKQGYKPDMKRLHYLEEDEIRTFWLHTEKESVVFLDEVGEFFNSMAWRELTKDPDIDPSSYARLHRKAGHDTYLIVQDLGHIFKQFRDLIHEHIELINLNHREFLGFKGPKRFIAKKFDMMDKDKAKETQTYPYNNKIFELYDTEQVYNVNSGVKTKEKQKYKETKLDEKKSHLRFISKFIGFFTKRLGCFIIILAIIFVVVILTRVPAFIGGLSSKMIKPNLRNEENTDTTTTDTENNPITGITDIWAGKFTTNAKKSTKSSGSGNHALIRYDTVTKRRP